ncbi:MAG: chloride channel protein [Pseudomonadota bacterium]
MRDGDPVEQKSGVQGRFRASWTRVQEDGFNEVQFWFVAVLVGIGAGFAAVAFREGILLLQGFIYGETDHALHTQLAMLHPGWVFGIPIAGGLAVGLILYVFTPDGRARSVADVIEGAALKDGRVDRKAGIASAIASMITLSTGGSTGREGPVVHLAAVMSSAVADWIKANPVTARDLLGCAVAAAVSASFNAPIAGTLFALEVILRHFAIHSMAPIAVSAVAGTVVSRLTSGDFAEFLLGDNTFDFYVEIPAFMILGLVCGCVAVVMMRSVFWAEEVGDSFVKRFRIPIPLRPAIAGIFLGAIAIHFPHIIGVGYETTNRALFGELLLHEAIIFVIVKVAAVAITLAGRMGGGIFSPSLMVGALTGLAFGLIATAIFPEVSGSGRLYALAGMGAVAAAVLGAPISTTLIVFELTRDWQVSIVVMVAVSMATAVSSRLVDKSFFLTQIERRGVHLAAGPQAYLLGTIRAGDLMRYRGAENGASDTQCWDLIEQGAFIEQNSTLEDAMPLFERYGATAIPVVKRHEQGSPELLGALFHVDALKAYNRALAETAEEEHS